MAPLTVLSQTSLHVDSLAALRSLEELSWGGDFYVAGSAGLVLYLDHRPIRDLDLMSSVQRLRSFERRDLLQDLLELDPDTRVETARDGFLYVRKGSGVALRFFYYPYPLVDPQEEIGTMAVASPIDLGLMKLGAVISRGTRRDFVDLYLLCRQIPLVELLERSREKFGHVEDFPLQALKGLADLSQIDGEPMPRLNRQLEWQEIESWLRSEVREVARMRVGFEPG